MYGAGVTRRLGTQGAAEAFLTIAPNSFAKAATDTAAAHELSTTPPTANPRENSRRKSSAGHRERALWTIEAHVFPVATADTDSVSAILTKGDEIHREFFGT